MLCPDHTEPIKTYKSYKAEKFEKYKSRQRSLVSGVQDSSLKDEDKRKLLIEMVAEIEKHF